MWHSARRSWHAHHVAHFNITVVLDRVADGHAVEHYRAEEAIARRLIELLDAWHLSATWGVNDPTFSAATSMVMRSPAPHEIAILGDPSWLGPTAGRTRFARELDRRVTKSRSMGLAVTSLVPRSESVQRHIDLLVKNGITAIASPSVLASSSSPTALHYGVWNLPVSVTFPQQVPGLWSAWRVKQVLRRAAHEAATFHLMIDAPALLEAGRRAEARLGGVAKRLSELQTRGLARIETLGATASRLSDVPAASPQRSILRSA